MRFAEDNTTALTQVEWSVFVGKAARWRWTNPQHWAALRYFGSWATNGTTMAFLLLSTIQPRVFPILRWPVTQIFERSFIASNTWYTTLRVSCRIIVAGLIFSLPVSRESLVRCSQSQSPELSLKGTTRSAVSILVNDVLELGLRLVAVWPSSHSHNT